MVVKLITLVLFLCLAAQDATAAKRIALVIANGDYTNLPKLDKVLADSRSLRVALEEELGFGVIYGENLGRREMNKKINELDAQVQAGDVVFISYAGHGVALDGENYMLPVDMQQPESGEEQFVISDSFGANALIRKLNGKKANATFVLLDANRNNPFEKQSIGLKKGLVRMDVPEGVFVLFTASQGQTSLDTVSAEDRNANSVFMRSLLPLLKMPGLTQIDLAKMVQERVSSIAAAAGQEQKPVYVDRFSDLVILNNGGGETPAQGKAQTENPAFALEEWKIVKDSGNRSVLEGFKAKYGSDPVWGPLVDQALLRLEEKPKRVATLPSTSGDDDFENKPLYRDLQTELRRVGCYNGAIDGTWGLSSRRALAQFARRQSQSVLPDENGLEILLASNSGICSRSAVSGSQKNVSKARPRSTVTVRRRAARPSRSCWSCTTYSYTTERICVASGVGNPAMRISHLIRCRRG